MVIPPEDIVHDCFSYPGFFIFPYEVDNWSLKVFKQLCGNFDGDCIESVDCFGQDGSFHCVNPTD